MRGLDISILLVEDDEIDRISIKRSLKTMRIANPIVEARDGQEALDILKGQGGKEKLARPYLIILDLNMPKMSGIEFLENLRSDSEIRDSVVFVLTTSNDPGDRAMAFQMNVAGYIVKSEAGPSFMQALDMMEHYWKIAEFPS